MVGSAGDDPGDAAVKGNLFARHRRAFIVSALVLAFMLLGTGSVFAGMSTATTQQPVASVGAATSEPRRALPEALPEPVALRTCSISAEASAPQLLDLYGAVVNDATSEVMYSKNGTVAQRPGSVMKVLTAAAAISVLGPDYRLTTRVVEGTEPGSIVLIGGGDATLSRLGAGQESVYAGAPKLADLAVKTLAEWELRYPDDDITKVVLDASYWSAADRWHPSWARSEQTIGYHSEVTALQVDGDRQDPRVAVSPRSTRPVMRAGEAFVLALGIGEVELVEGTAANGAALLAEVASQDMKTLVKQMLLSSDSTLAEMIARVVSKMSNLDGSAASLQRAITRPLEGLGMDVRDIVVRDGSGLSHENAVPPEAMAHFMIEVKKQTGGLEHVYAGLPVAGKTGSLASRFTGASSSAAGLVHAKTGWIESAHTLSGNLDASDGTGLSFAFYAVGDGITFEARTALDALVAAVHRCGNNLSQS